MNGNTRKPLPPNLTKPLDVRAIFERTLSRLGGSWIRQDCQSCMASKHLAKAFILLPRLQVLSRPSQPAHEKEVTLYIKGFLAQGETVDNFSDWLHSHHLLVLSHGWSPQSLGYSWPSGAISPYTAMPFAALGSIAYLAGQSWIALRKLRFPSLASIAGALVVDVGLHAARLAFQYHQAQKESTERAEALALRLLRLREEYDKIRIVSHSLGCRHLVEALGHLSPKEWPDSIHLCAPALAETETVSKLLRNPSADIRLYYTPQDWTLAVLFRAIVGARAMGEVGLREDYGERVRAIDVSRYLGMPVSAHTNYANRFHRFAAEKHTTKAIGSV
ncbi:uncharacterized protein VTP21DRAFT_4880 [Calcarisporiella thermophila]|uniref:uncharacterized protein n=1 Tax=Calcarisporiella thermophila TaxID=911321 RepID=UPI003742702F